MRRLLLVLGGACLFAGAPVHAATQTATPSDSALVTRVPTAASARGETDTPSLSAGGHVGPVALGVLVLLLGVAGADASSAKRRRSP